MGKIIRLFILSILLLSFLSFSYAAEQDKTPFELIIALSQSGLSGERIICAKCKNDKVPNFHILLKNISDKPQKIWAETCSWGYNNLSFELLVNDSNIIIKKVPISWYRNVPVYLILNPNEYTVFDIYITSNEWENFPKINSRTAARLKAIYEVKENEESEKFNVWTGRVDSSALNVVLFP